MEIKINNKLAELIKNLREQDSRMTSSPIFYVQVKKHVTNVCEDDSTGYNWISEDTFDEIDEEEFEKLSNDSQSKYFQSFYKEYYTNQQPFFTEAAAKEYIRANEHNLCEPRIYVESGWRNDEWNFIREYFLSLGENNDM